MDEFLKDGFHKKINIEFIASNPLTFIDFKYAQPAGENGLVQFITPNVYIVFHEIHNHKGMFNLATYLLGEERKHRFKQEYAVRYNYERIKEAFKDPNTFLFFSESEIKELEAVFKENQFLSNRVGVYSLVSGGSILNFDEDEFNATVEYLRKNQVYRVVGSIDRIALDDSYIYHEAHKAAYQKAKKQVPLFNRGKDNLSVNKVRKYAAATAALFAVSSVLQGVGRSLIGKGVYGTIGGCLMYTVGAFGNLLAFKFGTNLTNRVNEEVVFG